jgi:thymidylate synthase
VHGWPRNTFALRKLQKDIADYGGYPMGALTMITHSAHMYGDDFSLIENILMDHYEKELGYTPAVHFDFDKRGNVIVDLTDEASVPEGLWKTGVPMAIVHELKLLPKGNTKLLRATLYEPNGGPSVKEFVGRTPHEVLWQISDWAYVKDPEHAMYVGIELQKAYDCLVTGKQYHQDPA